MSESRESEWESISDPISRAESILDRDRSQFHGPWNVPHASTEVLLPQTRHPRVVQDASAPPGRLGSLGFESEGISAAIPRHEDGGIELQTFETGPQTQAPTAPAFPATIHHQAVPAVRTANLTRRSDLRIMPFLILLFILFYLSCGNVVNPRIHRIGKDFHTSHHEVMVQWSLFYAGYILIGIPFSLCLQFMLNSHAWFLVAFGFAGCVIFATPFVGNIHSLRSLRFLLGILGGQVLPGTAILLGRFYSKAELYVRFGLCVLVGTLFGAWSGFLGDALERASRSDRSATQHVPLANIYILEGLLIAFLGSAAIFLIPTSRTTRRVSLWRMLRCSGAFSRGDNTLRDSTQHQDRRFSLRCLANRHTALCSLALFQTNFILQSIPTFTPQIIAHMGLEGTSAQIGSAVPLAGSALWVIFLTVLCASNNITLTRFIYATFAAFSIVGAAGVLWVTAPVVRYIAVILLASGVIPAMPALLVCGVNRARSPREKALVAGFLSSTGALGGWTGGVIGLAHLAGHSEPGIWVGHVVNLIAAVSATVIGDVGIVLYDLRDS
ncbi:MFS general substrate transporter [Lophium mytilinum]|uniref:MFS general substrate transporter n=1 Tax=Lophium mytilinum TaxID=390894 RepID=A0A6A6QV53_9PEZI|nr:MFS general substrate transporter [Lophium mytilinum]